MILPPEWHPDSDWSSHRPLVYFSKETLQIPIIEFGCGDGLTPLLNYNDLSFENNYDWQRLYIEKSILVSGYFGLQSTFVGEKILFVDGAPGEDRAPLIDHYRSMATVIIVHDSEPGASYVYNLEPALTQFKYRCDLHIEGMPSTTAVSNFVDVSSWRGCEIGPYKIS